MKKELLQLIYLFKHWKHTQDISKSKEFKAEREKAEIIRLVHSIEKGLSLEKPRLGFGVKKINTLLDYYDSYSKEFGNDTFCLLMAYDTIAEYINFHKKKEYMHNDFINICNRFYLINHIEKSNEKFGGTLPIDSPVQNIDFNTLKNFFMSRHSIRDFKAENVSNQDIYEAVKVAQLSPSACNRQAVRAYVMSSQKLCDLYGDNLEGIGGFAHNVDKFILITGKISAYRMEEYNQYIVSASVFATYLMLALHAKNIGSCIIQRPLQYSKQWQFMQRKCNIPADEQLVLMLAVGIVQDKYSAPISKRFPTENILKYI